MGEVLSTLADVRAALAAELSGELSGKALINKCTEISRSLEPRGEIEEVVWHYLADADIRVRDREYARAQLQGVKELLAETE